MSLSRSSQLQKRRFYFDWSCSCTCSRKTRFVLTEGVVVLVFVKTKVVYSPLKSSLIMLSKRRDNFRFNADAQMDIDFYFELFSILITERNGQ